jgi:SPP1 family predicted phage head-tail adaptor
VIPAGRLDRRATLQRPDITRTAAGDAVTGYTTVAEVWAGKRDLRGREFLEAAATQAEAETLFTIRWRPDVAPSWRLLTEGRTFDIQHAAEIGRREALELRCVAAVAA